MKLRIKGNSIRLRLGQSEVRRLTTEGIVEESATFGPSIEHSFTYALCRTSDAFEVNATFAGGRIVVCVPEILIYQWATTDQISIQAIQGSGDHDALRILIEKDFECIDAPSGESQANAFPNPQFGAACHPVVATVRSL